MKEKLYPKTHLYFMNIMIRAAKTRVRILTLFLLLLCIFTGVSAQSVFVKAKLDSTQIWIGDQTNLTFEVVQKLDKKVLLPVFSDTIVGNLEIVEKAKLDTQKISDENIQVNVRYTITSFEDSLIYIPEFPFVTDGDTIWSNSLSLKVVQPFEIDTTSNTLADIKPVYKPPFNWKRFFLRGLLAMLLLAMLVVLYLLIRKFVMKKPIMLIETSREVITPHDEALQKLNILKEEKWWQKGRIKEYHTEITDIIRIYIDKMFNIRSMEMTSDEILNRIKFMKADKSGAYEALRQMLTLADLVKFAKWNPSPSDNEMSLTNAYTFVNQTKTEDVKKQAENKEQENKSELNNADSDK